MRVFIIFLFIIISYGENLDITKYVTNTIPKIIVEQTNVPTKLLRMLNKDSKLLTHYNVIFKTQIKDRNQTDNYGEYNYLLQIKYTKNSLTAKLKNLISNKVVLYKRYKIPNFNTYPFMIHSLSYDINEKLGYGKAKWIKSKLVYAVSTAPKESSIFLSDVTLTYRKKIISGGLNIFPKWANPTQTEIYYTKLENRPVLYKYNIFTGQKSRIFSSNGMLIVSDVKKDNLLLTLAIDDQPDIYKYNLKTKKLQRITKYPGIDVNGQFYGDNDIVFISDRLGYPNVYQKNLLTNSISRVIFNGKNHISVTTHKDNVVVSSRETNKAFGDNTFNLLLVNRNNNIVKRLTFGGKNILPTFSQSGDTILFIKKMRFNSQLGIIRLKENKIFYFKLSKRMQSFDF